MIFVVVGSTGRPFTRLWQAVDTLAGTYGYDVTMQTSTCAYTAEHCRTFGFIDYLDFIKYYRQADLIISHASSGPLLYSRMYEKPIVVVPRIYAEGEEFDHHQERMARVLAQEDEPMRRVIFDIRELEKGIPAMLALPHKKYREHDHLNRLRSALRDELLLCRGRER